MFFYRRYSVLLIFITCFLLSSCGGAKRELVSPKKTPQKPIPLWSAVTENSTLGCEVKLTDLQKISLFELIGQMLKKEVFSKSEVSYDEIVKEVGFDLFSEISDIFITDMIIDNQKRYVVLGRFKKETDLLEIIAKFMLMAIGRHDMEKLKKHEIFGRKAITALDESASMVQVDSLTVALIEGGERNAKYWLDQTFKMNQKRNYIINILSELSKDEILGGRQASISAYADLGYKKFYLPIKDEFDWGYMKEVSLILSTEKDVFAVMETEYRDEQSAQKFEEEIRGFFNNPPPILSIFSEQLSKVKKNLKVKVNGKKVRTGTVIPEDVLETLYVTLKMFSDSKGFENLSIENQ